MAQCHHCGDRFKGRQAVRAHLQWCEPYLARKSAQGASMGRHEARGLVSELPQSPEWTQKPPWEQRREAAEAEVAELRARQEQRVLLQKENEDLQAREMRETERILREEEEAREARRRRQVLRIVENDVGWATFRFSGEQRPRVRDYVRRKIESEITPDWTERVASDRMKALVEEFERTDPEMRKERHAAERSHARLLATISGEPEEADDEEDEEYEKHDADCDCGDCEEYDED